MNNMLQSFLRVANLYNPQQMANTASEPIPTLTRPPQFPTSLGYDESISAPVEEPQSSLEAFRQSVLHPPQREHMTYPKSTLNGLTEALKIAATPTDYEKNRVYVNGQAYQQVRAYKDPTTGETKFINKYKQPGFMEQVMKAMPAAVSSSVDILNQPFEDAKADWEMKNKGLASAVNAEAQMALAKQREASAGYTGQRADIERDRIAVQRMTAEERVRASQLNTLTDEEKLQMLQEGRISLADINNAAAMQRVQAQQAGALERTNVQQTGANQRTAATQAGANARTAATVAGANQRNAARIEASKNTAGVTSQLPTQQKVALQNKTQQLINQHPEWSDYISFNDQGFPIIEPPSTGWFGGGPDKATYDAIYNALYGAGQPAPINTPQNTAPPTKAPGSSKMPPPKVKAAPGSTSTVPMITPDGKGVRMVPENQVQTALSQGYKYKTAK